MKGHNGFLFDHRMIARKSRNNAAGIRAVSRSLAHMASFVRLFFCRQADKQHERVNKRKGSKQVEIWTKKAPNIMMDGGGVRAFVRACFVCVVCVFVVLCFVFCEGYGCW